MARFSLEEVSPKRDRQRPYPKNRDTDPDAHDTVRIWQQERQKQKQYTIEANQQYAKEKAEQNAKAAKELNRRKDVVMQALEKQAEATPFTGTQYKEASNAQREKALAKAKDYKNVIRSLVTAGELGFSGGSLLGAWANYRNWATGANLTKRTIANLLQKAQLPMQVGGTLIDGYQTYDALNNNNDFEAKYNGASMGLGLAGSVGASDVFLNSRFHNPTIDRILDVLGIIQNSGDFVKFGYDALKGDNK
jgi:hypothetical protein